MNLISTTFGNVAGFGGATDPIDLSEIPNLLDDVRSKSEPKGKAAQNKTEAETKNKTERKGKRKAREPASTINGAECCVCDNNGGIVCEKGHGICKPCFKKCVETTLEGVVFWDSVKCVFPSCDEMYSVHSRNCAFHC